MYDEFKTIWSPHYTARDFRPNRRNANAPTNRMRPYQVKNSAYTPKYGYKKNHRDMTSQNQRHTPMRMQRGKSFDTPKKKANIDMSQKTNKKKQRKRKLHNKHHSTFLFRTSNRLLNRHRRLVLCSHKYSINQCNPCLKCFHRYNNSLSHNNRSDP